MTPAPLLAECLTGLDGIRHGFLTRSGGISCGIHASLNCGYGSRDRASDVAENRRRVAVAFSAADGLLNTLHQVHGTTVALLDRPFEAGRGPKADAMVTRTPGLALAVLTADCAPVLFADAEAAIVGAAHAGWRGALGGVVNATIDFMLRLGARTDRMHAAIGPCIGPPSYEVGVEFKAAFLAVDGHFASHFSAGGRPGHCQFDLPGFLAERLRARGLARVENLGRDTYGEPESFFSYRRASHRGEDDYGRHASVIMLA